MGYMNIVSKEDQAKIRHQLKNMIIKDPIRGDYLAKEIGIAAPTLMKFLANDDVSLRIITKIMQWIDKKEKA